MVASPNSARLGRPEPRLFTPPLRELTRENTRGFEAVEFAEQVLGVVLMPWQRWLLLHLLELLPDGSFRFRTAVVLVARQNGKTTLVQVLALWRLYVDGAALVIGTAQNLDVAEEAWQGAVEMAEGVPDLASEIAHVDKTNGKKQLRLQSGERYKVAAASRRGGRGLSGDLVILDELREHKTWAAWGAVTKTTMARARPQIVGLSNAGDAESVVLASLRERAMLALAGGTDAQDDGSLGLFDWSAPDGCALDDMDGWAQANPALGHTITEQAIRAALSTDPEEVLRTEVLCQWVDKLVPPVIDVALWASLAISGAVVLAPVAFAVTVAPDRSYTWVAVAGSRPDGREQVEVAARGPGADWAAAWLVSRVARWDPCAVVLDGSARLLAQPLEAAGVDPLVTTTATRVQATVGLFDAVSARRLAHTGDPDLSAAVADARKREIGDGWVWEGEHVGPLQAVTLARWGLVAHGRRRPPAEPLAVSAGSEQHTHELAVAGF